MINLKRFFTVLLISILLFSPLVFATEEVPTDQILITSLDTPQVISGTPTVSAEIINEDCHVSGTDSYTLDSIVHGNVFATVYKFLTNPRNGGGILSGNLFLISTDSTIASDVTYSNNTDNNGNYIISSINSKSIINGNVFALSENFTLEAGSEIHGDLYVAAQKVNIEQDSIIDGSVFIAARDVSINGQISGSAYITTENFNMNYFAYITRDLNLAAENTSLSGIVYRNAFISSYSLTANKEFRVNGNLTVDYSKNFTYSGEVYGNASINAESLSFKKDDSTKCIIQGNLVYGVKNETQIPDGVVSGTISQSQFVDKETDKFDIKDTLFSLVIFIAYVLGITFIAKFFAKNAISKLPEFNTKNVFISLGIGLLSFFVIILLFVLLLVSSIGIYLAFALVIAYLFIIAISVPLFLNKIAELIKLDCNDYVKLLCVAIIFFVIKLIPVIGSLVSFVVFTAGIGQIIFAFLSRKK